jgi:hypothetical protein
MTPILEKLSHLALLPVCAAGIPEVTGVGRVDRSHNSKQILLDHLDHPPRVR